MSTADLAETERAILAACLHDPAAVDNAQALGLTVEHFGLRGHRALWVGMVHDRSDGTGPDEATLFDRHELNVGDGRPFADFAALNAVVMALRGSRPKQRHLESYITRLGEQRVRVALASTARLVSSMIEDNEPTQDALDAAESGLLEAAKGRRAGFSFTRLGEVVGPAWEHHDAVARGDVVDTRIETGIATLDAILRLRPKHYSVWAARPSMGKTQAALSALRNIAARQIPSLLVSIEMDRGSLAERIVGAEIATGARAPEEAISWWNRIPLFIDDTSTTLAEVCSSIRLHVMRHRVQFVVVDYLQIIRFPDNPSRERQIADASMQLKALAKETGVALVLIAQINRAVEQRGDKRPVMSDLRESGALEQDADSIVMLYRGLYYNRATAKPHELEAIIRKQRNGKVGTAFVWYEVGKWVTNPPLAQMWDDA